jgi:hypothetical protein
MNSTASTRRLIRIFAALALTGTAAFALGLALTTLALPLFAVTAGAFTLLVVARDYAPRASSTRIVAPVATFPSPRERMALAA